MGEFNYTEYLKNNPLLKKEDKKSLTEGQRPGYHADGTPKSNDEMSDDEREEFYNDSNFIDEEKSSTDQENLPINSKVYDKNDIDSALAEFVPDFDEKYTKTGHFIPGLQKIGPSEYSLEEIEEDLRDYGFKLSNVPTKWVKVQEYDGQANPVFSSDGEFQDEDDVKVYKFVKLIPGQGLLTAEAVSQPKSLEEEKSSTKMKVSELKAKIKEDIISTLSEQDEDYEQASREMEYGISPEGGELEDELMQDLEENHQSLDSEIANRIEGLLNIPMKKQFLEIGKDLIQDLTQDDPFDIDDIISHLANELIKYTQDLQTTPLNEEKKEEDEEDVDVEVEDDLDIESEEGSEETEAEPENAGVSAEAGFSKEEKDIQDGLKQAYDQAVAVGDEKLADQIGNTITMFTRTHVVNR